MSVIRAEFAKFWDKSFGDDQQVVVYCPDCPRGETGILSWPWGILIFEGLWKDICEDYEKHKHFHPNIHAVDNSNGRYGI